MSCKHCHKPKEEHLSTLQAVGAGNADDRIWCQTVKFATMPDGKKKWVFRDNIYNTHYQCLHIVGIDRNFCGRCGEPLILKMNEGIEGLSL